MTDSPSYAPKSIGRKSTSGTMRFPANSTLDTLLCRNDKPFSPRIRLAVAQMIPVSGRYLTINALNTTKILMTSKAVNAAKIHHDTLYKIIIIQVL